MREYGKCRKRAKGFSLLELMVSLAVFLVVAGTIMSSMMSAQKSFRTSEIRTGLEQTMRSALEMMAQDIGQAGLQPAGADSKGLGAPLATVLISACSSGTCIKGDRDPTHDPQPVPVNSVAGIYPGEWLWVDVGPGAVGAECYSNNAAISDPVSYCEQVQVEKVDPGPPALIYAKFRMDHSYVKNGIKNPTPFYALGAYPQGIVPSGAKTSSGSVLTGSTPSQLKLFGDINGTGNSLQYVVYTCPSSTPGNFTRTVYDATSSSNVPISTTTLLSNVTACEFKYPDIQNPASLGIPGGVLTSVGISLEAQSQTKDPQTGQPVKIKKSFLNIQPRNIISALKQVSSCPDPTSPAPAICTGNSCIPAVTPASCQMANELQRTLPPGVQ
jgi:prepilin-type N-terminal cleavage/methylation domain-containing protein